MGWTAPATYSVSEIVTAAKLNTHIRDNFDYLKGNAGGVVISDTLRAPVVAINIAPPSYASLTIGSNAEIYMHNVVPNTINGGGSQNTDNIDLWFNYVGYNGSTTRDRNLQIGDGKNNQIASFVGSTRNVGIGTASPQGKLHVASAGGGFLVFPYSGVGASTTTLLPAGSVTAALSITHATKPSTGTPNVGQLNNNTLGSTQTLYTDGGANVFGINLVADGSVTITRTAGTRTYSGAITLTWA